MSRLYEGHIIIITHTCEHIVVEFFTVGLSNIMSGSVHIRKLTYKHFTT